MVTEEEMARAGRGWRILVALLTVQSFSAQQPVSFYISLGALGFLPKQCLLRDLTGSPNEIRHNFSSS